MLFQRSHWVKGYYVPAVVAAANAQHPVFRVQNGTKVSWWASDALGPRGSFEHLLRAGPIYLSIYI